MFIKHVKKIVAAGTFSGTVLLTGCAGSLGMGNSDYGCTGYPDGVQCLSTREVYGMTHQPGAITSETVENRKISEMAVEQQAGQPHVLSQSPISQEPIPLRTRPGILRIWVAPWEASNGDLNVSGLVYTELEERRWNIGVIENHGRNHLSPLKTD